MAKHQTGTIQYKDLVMQKIKAHYQSIVLGILVLLVATSIIVRLSSSQKNTATSQSKNEAEETTVSQEAKPNNKTYTVKKGDNLWIIAQKQYGSGYNQMDIAKANKIKNPDIIEVGMTLLMPEVKAQAPTGGIIAEAKTEKVTITEKDYKIKAGDTLWNVALQAYGDGYQWVKIAKANKLSNPDIIHKDNMLTLPR